MRKDISKYNLELRGLARQINSAEDTLEEFKRKMASDAQAASAEIILQGRALGEAARLCGGLFVDWLGANCGRIDKQKACRRIKYSQQTSRLQKSFFNELGLRETSESETQPRVMVPENAARYRMSCVLRFMAKHNWTAWAPENHDELREDLKPVVKTLWPDANIA